MAEIDRIAHYASLAAQFLEWSESETNEEARQGLLDMARQYERLVAGLKARRAASFLTASKSAATSRSPIPMPPTASGKSTT